MIILNIKTGLLYLRCDRCGRYALHRGYTCASEAEFFDPPAGWSIRGRWDGERMHLCKNCINSR